MGESGGFVKWKLRLPVSFVAYPASGRLEVADGYPCQVGYAEVF